MPFRFFGPDTLPQPFDVVWCRFPYRESPDLPADVSHPALVRQSLIDNEGRPWVRLIYGTSKVERKGSEYFDVPPDAGRQCGLRKPTRFNLDRELRLPWAEEFFETASGLPPRTRALPDATVKDFQIHAAHYQNERGA